MNNFTRGVGLTLVFGFSVGTVTAQAPADLGDPASEVDYSQFDDDQKQAFCMEVRKVTDQLNTQVPLQIDPTTRLISATTVYIQGICHLRYGYMLEEKPLLKMLQDVISQQADQDVDIEFVQQWFSRGEGFTNLKQSLKQEMLSEPNFAQLVSVPFVVAEADYQVMGEHIENFSLMFGES
jgi:hypothetical protein